MEGSNAGRDPWGAIRWIRRRTSIIPAANQRATWNLSRTWVA